MPAHHLSSSARNPNQERLKKALINKEIEKLIGVIASNVNINATLKIEREHYTPLNYAIYRGWSAGVTTLLNQGASPNMASERVGCFPLHVAIKSQRVQSVEIVNILLERGANPNQKDQSDISPLYLAARNGLRKIVSPLITQGADLRMKNKAQQVSALDAAMQHEHWKTAGLLMLAMVDKNISFSISGTQAKEIKKHASSKQVDAIVEIVGKLQKQVSSNKKHIHYRFSSKHSVYTQPKETSYASASTPSKQRTAIINDSDASNSVETLFESSHIEDSDELRERFNTPNSSLHSDIQETATPTTRQVVDSTTSKGKGKTPIYKLDSNIITYDNPSHFLSKHAIATRQPKLPTQSETPEITRLRSSFLNQLEVTDTVKESSSDAKHALQKPIKNSIIEATDLADAQSIAAAAITADIATSDIERIKEKEMSEETETVECESCYLDVPQTSMLYCTTGSHACCPDCIKQWAGQKNLGHVKEELECTQPGCNAHFDVSNTRVRSALGAVIAGKVDALKQNNEIEQAEIEGLACCPFCDYKAIYPPIEDNAPTFACEYFDCQKISCRTCQNEALPGHVCQKEALERVEEAMSEALFRKCPNPSCKQVGAKDGGCNKITCEKCGTIMCDCCKKDITLEGYNHFSSELDYLNRPHNIRLCKLYDDQEARYAQEVEAAKKQAIEAIQATDANLNTDTLQDAVKELGKQKQKATVPSDPIIDYLRDLLERAGRGDQNTLPQYDYFMDNMHPEDLMNPNDFEALNNLRENIRQIQPAYFERQPIAPREAVNQRWARRNPDFPQFAYPPRQVYIPTYVPRINYRAPQPRAANPYPWYYAGR